MKPITRAVRNLRTWVVICAVVIPLTLVLGLLQFQWLGELSERERESRQFHLAQDVARFSGEFDRELTRIYFAFRWDAAALERRDGREAVARYTAWVEQTSYPRLVRDVWLAESVDSAPASEPATSWRFFHLDARQQNFTASPQPPGWREPDNHFPGNDPLDEGALALAIPVASVSQAVQQQSTPPRGVAATFMEAAKTRFVIVQLDRECIMDEVLPALTRRYFSDSSSFGNFEYQVAIVRARAPHQIVYAENLRDNGILPVSADAMASLFGLRPQLGSRGVALAARLSAAPGHPVGPLARGVAAVAMGAALAWPDYWQLRVTHRVGSLEALAIQTRQRNLVISMTILLLLAGALILLLVASRRTRALAQQQMEFVAGISHELRTPVAVICMTGANLADGLIGTADQVRQYGQLIRQEGRRLTEMVEQVLCFARIEADNRPPYQPVNIDMLIREAVQSIRPQVGALGYSCIVHSYEALPPVMADRACIERVMQNLLSNALKYSTERGEIHVSAGREALPTGARLWVSVEDHGIGIPADELRSIFEPFRRGRAAIERNLPGTGLGLSLVERIV
jgi:signal transduction histidine kinase